MPRRPAGSIIGAALSLDPAHEARDDDLKRGFSRPTNYYLFAIEECWRTDNASANNP